MLMLFGLMVADNYMVLCCCHYVCVGVVVCGVVC